MKIMPMDLEKLLSQELKKYFLFIKIFNIYTFFSVLPRLFDFALTFWSIYKKCFTTNP